MTTIGKTRPIVSLLVGASALLMAATPALAQTSLDNDASLAISGSKNSQTLYQVSLPAGSTDLTVSTSGGKGNMTLYVNDGSVVTTSSYDCRSSNRGNNESCSFSGTQDGTFSIMVYGKRSYQTTLTASYTPPQLDVNKIAGIGDSITMAFGADCTGNVWLWDLACLLAGDQPEHSWFDGWSSSVDSVHDKYKAIKSSISANKHAAESGAEMLGIGNSNRNFLDQANVVVSQSPTPDHVEVFLGGNDICNRDCTDAANCGNPLYTESEWRGAVQDGMDVLVGGMPDGGTVLLGSVPRVQNLRAAGVNKETGFFAINCQSAWATYGICRIVTNSGTHNGESMATRHNAIEAAQQLYNEVLREEAEAYNSNSNGKNPRGIEVISEYVDEFTPSAGTFEFTQEHINGADCFHPNVPTHSTVADLVWSANTDQ